jgi:hypothetical protein
MDTQDLTRLYEDYAKVNHAYDPSHSRELKAQWKSLYDRVTALRDAYEDLQERYTEVTGIPTYIGLEEFARCFQDTVQGEKGEFHHTVTDFGIGSYEYWGFSGHDSQIGVEEVFYEPYEDEEQILTFNLVVLLDHEKEALSSPEGLDMDFVYTCEDGDAEVTVTLKGTATPIHGEDILLYAIEATFSL